MSNTCTHVAIWNDNPIPIVTPLLQPDTQCDQLVLFHLRNTSVSQIQRFLSSRRITLVAVECLDEHHLPLECLNSLEISSINLTQGSMQQKDALLNWARERHIPCFWLNHNTDTIAYLAPHNSTPVPVADRLKIEEFLQLKGIQVTELERQPSQFKSWTDIATRWVNALSHYEKGFGVLNFLAKSATADTHKSKPLTLAQQNNTALRRLLNDLEENGLVTQDGNRVQFANADAKRFCNGIWLEYFALSQLKKLAKERSDIQDIAMSVKVERGERDNVLRNEIDLIALINNRLYIIECKTGTLESKESQLALYRLDAIADVFGPLTQGALLSFDGISPLIKRRANELNIQILDRRKMVQLKSSINRLADKYATPDEVNEEVL
ncbi:Card1-like endonuclease domain-containing protein [Vibrio mexicanus]|uniref:Card1-like endonuclease domain-containing protein n=1 Tax=Vibrio mexicanus TaxID=1004326 RepID=UPI0009494E2A|nr:DUF1887 family CARF protein [Vibrio mexicanus]